MTKLLGKSTSEHVDKLNDVVLGVLTLLDQLNTSKGFSAQVAALRANVETLRQTPTLTGAGLYFQKLREAQKFRFEERGQGAVIISGFQELSEATGYSMPSLRTRLSIAGGSFTVTRGTRIITVTRIGSEADKALNAQHEPVVEAPSAPAGPRNRLKEVVAKREARERTEQ